MEVIIYSHIFFPSHIHISKVESITHMGGRFWHRFDPPLWTHRTHHGWSWDASFHERPSVESSKELVLQCQLEEVESNDPMQKCNPLLLRSWTVGSPLGRLYSWCFFWGGCFSLNIDMRIRNTRGWTAGLKRVMIILFVHAFQQITCCWFNSNPVLSFFSQTEAANMFFVCLKIPEFFGRPIHKIHVRPPWYTLQPQKKRRASPSKEAMTHPCILVFYGILTVDVQWRNSFYMWNFPVSTLFLHHGKPWNRRTCQESPRLTPKHH